MLVMFHCNRPPICSWCCALSAFCQAGETDTRRSWLSFNACRNSHVGFLQFSPLRLVSRIHRCPKPFRSSLIVFEHILQSWSFPESLKLLQQSWDRAVDGDCELCLNCRWPCKDPLIIYLFSGHRKGRMICGHWCDGPRAVEQEYLDPRSIKMCVCVFRSMFVSFEFFLSFYGHFESLPGISSAAEQQSRCATCRCCPNRDPVGKDRNSQCLCGITHDHFWGFNMYWSIKFLRCLSHCLPKHG